MSHLSEISLNGFDGAARLAFVRYRAVCVLCAFRPHPRRSLDPLLPRSTMCSSHAVDFLRALPKCEHHIHIEGSLEPDLLFSLSKKNSIPLSADLYSTIEALEERYKAFANLDDFLAYFNAGMDVLIYEDDFEALAYAYMRRGAADGLAHAEIFFDPQAHTGRGIELDVVVKGLKKGLRKGEQEFGISTELIMCFVKHLSVDAACEAVQQMAPYVASGDVIGLGADSTEKNNHPSKFAPVYDLARQVGFPRLTMHSGEEGPASWVRSTVFDLGIKRVDHAVHAADDEKLLDDLVKLGGVMFTVCPLSNVRLRVHKSVSESPIPLFLKKGIPFSINSDDPSYFGGFLLDNYVAVQDAFSFPPSTWETIVRNGIEGSWCSEKRKTELKEKLAQVMGEWEGKEL